MQLLIFSFSANRMAPYPNRYWCIYYQLLLLELGVDFLPSVKKNFSKGTIRNCCNRKVQELIFPDNSGNKLNMHLW